MPRFLLISAIMLSLLILYLNRAYAHFFNNIKTNEFPAPYLTQQSPGIIVGKQNSVPKITYLALGDSLTAGIGTNNIVDTFPYLYAQKIASDSAVQVVNKAVPGAKIANLPAQINDIQTINPQIITILIGINDIFNRTPLQQFANQYDQILTELEDKTEAKIIVLTIPYLGTTQSVLPPYKFLYDYQLTRYNNQIRSIANKHPRTTIFDLYQPTKQLYKDKTYFAIDQFHPSAKGYILWSELLNDANFYSKSPI